MPHVIVKLGPGKSEDHTRRLAEAITKNVMKIFYYGEESVSVAMEEEVTFGDSRRSALTSSNTIIEQSGSYLRG